MERMGQIGDIEGTAALTVYCVTDWKWEVRGREELRKVFG